MLAITDTASNLSPSLRFESLLSIDMATLSQSELQALSLCSDSAFDIQSTTDLVSPKIDPSVFNESAGTHRQTYSRLRLPDSVVTGHRRRVAGLLPIPIASTLTPTDDPELAEDNSIIHFLKQYIAGEDIKPPPDLHSSSLLFDEAKHDAPPPPIPVSSKQIVPSEGKRKRGRKAKLLYHDHGPDLEMISRDTSMNLLGSNSSDDVFTAELKKKTLGLEAEEEILGFLRNLEGQWGSRRKKRKIVDARQFGTSLPVGWKLLLGLRRREGRVSVYCRRYIR